MTTAAGAPPEATGPDLPGVLFFASAFCAPCTAARRVLVRAQELLPALEVREFDVASDPGAGERWDVRSTPTIVLTDGTRELFRAAGAPTLPQLLAVIGSRTVGNLVC
jgi:hypothetical protein